MLGLDTLDVGIGMALMFLFVSLIASAVREFGESLLKTRASALERGLKELLQSDIGNFYNNALISALYQKDYATARTGGLLAFVPWLGRSGLPSYIPSESSAKAVLQLTRAADDSASLDVVKLRTWAAGNDTRLKAAVLSALDTADGDLGKVRTELEHWFDSAMDRVSGWYKRRTQYWLFFIGLVCAALMNIDAITVMQHLSTDKALRESVAKAAGETLKTGADKILAPALDQVAKEKREIATLSCAEADKYVTSTSQTKAIADEKAASEAEATAKACAPATAPSADAAKTGAADAAPGKGCVLSLDGVSSAAARMGTLAWPIGWIEVARDKTAVPPWYADFDLLRPGPQYLAIAEHDQPWWFAAKVGLGWLITALGVTFGASFWFDVLNKFMVIRSTIKPDEKSPKEKSKDGGAAAASPQPMRVEIAAAPAVAATP